jgi:uncharacterized repeat protein (TIGR01451 family)
VAAVRSHLRWLVVVVAAMPAAVSFAGEMTLKNDSVTDFGAATIVTGFIPGEAAAAWLTAPCTGNLRAAQVLWRSASGGSAPEFGRSFAILRSGTFPNPGAVAQTIFGPVLTDGVINEYRYLDENNTVPLVVPVVQNETVVVAFTFDAAPPDFVGPSVVRDNDGCQAGRNAILANVAGNFIWFSSCSLGLAGDFTIRAVVDCGAGGPTANLSAAKSAMAQTVVPGGVVDYTLTIANAGPDTAVGASVTDAFPAAFASVQWACAASAGSICTPASGSGSISQLVSLAPMGSIVFAAQATTRTDSTGAITNNVAVTPPAGVTDPSLVDNIGSVVVNVLVDPLFDDGFEDP